MTEQRGNKGKKLIHYSSVSPKFPCGYGKLSMDKDVKCSAKQDMQVEEVKNVLRGGNGRAARRSTSIFLAAHGRKRVLCNFLLSICYSSSNLVCFALVVVIDAAFNCCLRSH